MDLGEKLGIVGFAVAVVAIFLPYVFKTMPWYITYSGISIAAGIFCFGLLVWFVPPSKTGTVSVVDGLPASPVPAAASAVDDGLTSEERQYRAMRAGRSARERALANVGGTSVKHDFNRTGIGKFEVSEASDRYTINISKGGSDQIWIYAKDDSGFTKLGIVRSADAVTGKMVDFRLLRDIRGSASMLIGDRAFLEGKDGRVIQLVLTGVLYYEAGDPSDQARFKYKIFDKNDFLIPLL